MAVTFHPGPARMLASACEEWRRPYRADQIIMESYDSHPEWKDIGASKSGYEIKRERFRTFLRIALAELTITVLEDYRDSLRTGVGPNFAQIAVLQHEDRLQALKAGREPAIIGHVFFYPTLKTYTGKMPRKWESSGILLEFETRESRALDPWILRDQS